MTTWPGPGLALMHELMAHPGRFALVEKDAGTRALLEQLAKLIDSKRVSVGRLLAHHDAPPSQKKIVDDLAGQTVLCDIDVLFTPALATDPGALLRELARRAKPLIAEWPGRLNAGRASYSEHGRHDHYDRILNDVVILRPVATTFPDECPFTIERWSP